MRRLSEDARRAMLQSATLEANRLGSGRIGTEHILLALIGESDSLGALTLKVDLATARQALTDLDRLAMWAVGIDATPLDRPRGTTRKRRLPFTSGAREVLKSAVDHARSHSADVITDHDLLRSLLNLTRPDPAAQLIDALQVDRTEALDRENAP